MKKLMLEHSLSLLLVTALAIAAILFFSSERAANREENAIPRELAGFDSTALNSRFEEALLRDAMDLFYPGRHDENTQKIDALLRAKSGGISKSLERSHLEERLSPDTIRDLLRMFFQFFGIYTLVTALTLYGVQTLGVWKFISRKVHAERGVAGKTSPKKRLKRAAVRAAALAGNFALFSPAYVIAYAIRTEFSTDSAVFLILLAVVSNGLLVTYAQKFYSFLITESRKGYVETAIAKNLTNTYDPKEPGGIPIRKIFRIRKRFENHVFGHIFSNARHQYTATIKEQSSFLITGLIIIEMALNIHGHMSYEMLRQMLFGNFDIVIAIMLAIFYTVKITEIAVDFSIFRNERRYANASS